MAQRRFMDLLVIPWVDKTIVILATIPFAVELYRRWVVGHVNFPRAVLGLQVLVIIIVMVLRTAPVRVTPNPWFRPSEGLSRKARIVLLGIPFIRALSYLCWHSFSGRFRFST